MMHVVPNSLQSATDSEQHPLTACLSPEYSAPSSPFDFDIDFLISDCTSVPQQQQQPAVNSSQLSAAVDNSDADSGINLEGGSCSFNQVPNSERARHVLAVMANIGTLKLYEILLGLVFISVIISWNPYYS